MTLEAALITAAGVLSGVIAYFFRRFEGDFKQLRADAEKCFIDRADLRVRIAVISERIDHMTARAHECSESCPLSRDPVPPGKTIEQEVQERKNGTENRR